MHASTNRHPYCPYRYSQAQAQAHRHTRTNLYTCEYERGQQPFPGELCEHATHTISLFSLSSTYKYTHINTHMHAHAQKYTFTHSSCLFRYILPDFSSKPVVVMWLYCNFCGKEREKKEKKKRKVSDCQGHGFLCECMPVCDSFDKYDDLRQ